ncbi:MAG TPA: hypothetical protein VGG63_18090 [Steroidobacteraceae bacterium]
MKIPISMFCPLPPEFAAPAGADDEAEVDEPLPVSLVAALPLFEVLATLPPW